MAVVVGVRRTQRASGPSMIEGAGPSASGAGGMDGSDWARPTATPRAGERSAMETPVAVEQHMVRRSRRGTPETAAAGGTQTQGTGRQLRYSPRAHGFAAS
jgi:hypothetical protein